MLPVMYLVVRKDTIGFFVAYFVTQFIILSDDLIITLGNNNGISGNGNSMSGGNGMMHMGRMIHSESELTADNPTAVSPSSSTAAGK